MNKINTQMQLKKMGALRTTQSKQKTKIKPFKIWDVKEDSLAFFHRTDQRGDNEV